jgi:hopanoid C-3 methylase
VQSTEMGVYMKILLINPPYPKRTVGFHKLLILEPLSLEYLGAILKSDNHEVKILDMVIDPNLDKTLNEFHPDVVSSTSFYVHKFLIKDIYKKIKEFDSNIHTIIAGSHAVIYPEEYYDDNVDIVNVGEDLLVAPKLMKGIEQGDLSDIEGIHYKTKDGWVKGPNGIRCISIDDLPFPDRTLTKEYHKHYYWYFEKEVASVWGSVGCPYKCYYCTQWKKNGGHFVSRTPESLVAEIEKIEQEAVFIVDDNTFTDANRAKRIVELIKEKNIKKKFMCYCSPNLVIKNRDIIQEWKKYGLVKIMVGFESIRKGDLTDVQRKTSLESNNEAIRILREIGMDTMAGFIIYPDFTKEDFLYLRKYIKQSRLYYIEYTSLTPFPGTLFYDEVKNDIIFNGPELFDMQHILLKSELPLKEYYKQIMLLYLYSYLPHRALRANLNFKISLNPFNKMYRNFIVFLWKTRFAYNDHIKLVDENKIK